MQSTHPSIIRRVAIAKSVGFLFGLLGMYAMPYVVPETDWFPRIGILLWYSTMGAVIAFFATYFGGEGPETLINT